MDRRSPRPLTRPTLLPGLRRIWRGRHRLQLGTDPTRAVVLELSDPGAAGVLDLLDGARSEGTVLTQAGHRGIRPRDAQAVIDQLRATGLVVSAQSLYPCQPPGPVRERQAREAAALALSGPDGTPTPAPMLRRRSVATVMITGGGPVAAVVAVTLARSGVGHVSPVLDDPSEQTDVTAMVTAEAPGTRVAPVRARDATFAVQVEDRTPAVLAAERYAQRRLPHLAVSMRDGTAIVGPLVPPGGSPCLHCLDLHRLDRDPDWPEVAAQLATHPGPSPCAATTAVVAGGLAAGEVLSWLDGVTSITLGGSLEITVRGRVRRRSWPPHPACDCARRARRRAATLRPPAVRATTPPRPQPPTGGSRTAPVSPTSGATQ